MPILMMTPDMMAETWLGAIAWALGSQMWSGMTPALSPKPAKARTKMAVATPGVRPSGRSGSSVKEPLAAWSSANSPNRQRVAVCVADQVKVAGVADLPFFVLGRDQEEGRKRHDLPTEEEQDAVAGDHHERHAGRQHAVE